MAQSTKAQPSIEGIFQVLASIPENQLLKFRHKLNSIQQDRKSCQLLQAMILLTLRREMEARVSLDTLGDDPTAAYIYKSHRSGAKANGTSPLPREQEAEVAVTVAQIYSLLVDEQLCDPQARVEAYTVAIKTAQASNSIKEAKLDKLIHEAQGKCGLAFGFPVVNYDCSAVRSGAGKFQVPAARSCPLPINNGYVPPDPQPLRSTGTSDSFVSHLEISQSPTVPFLTRSVHQPGISGSSKLCESASNPLAETGEEETSSKLPASCLTKSPAAFSAQDEPKSRLLVSPDLRPAPSVEERVNHPVECTEPQTIVAVGLQDPQGSTHPYLHVSSSLQPGSDTKECISTAVEDSRFPAQSTDPGPFSSDFPRRPPAGSLSTDLQCEEGQFFTFVVLHASEDEPIACRVKDRLEDMGVSNGATFSENFLIPGHCQFSCFENALDNSAFTLLLLTENFKGRICAYQSSVALMDSFTRFLKNNTVIPFVPKENPIKRQEMPMLLSSLVALDENSPVFAKRVKNTFPSHVIEEKRRAWNYMQAIQNRKRLQEQQHNYLLMEQRLSEINIAGYPTQTPFPPPQMGFPGLHQAPPGYVPEPFFRPPLPQTQLGPAQPFLSQPFAVSLGPPSLTPGGPQPQLIIQNAQMIQIGDHNQMQVERTNTELHTAGKEVCRNQLLEGESEGERTEE